MTQAKSEVLANHERYVERKALYSKFGYDMEQEMALIIEKARPISGKILEAGTGKGHFALALAKEGFEFTSFDISEVQQKCALLNLMYYGLEQKVCFDIANAESLGYGQDYYDVIFSVNMIHHLSHARTVCDEFIRVLTSSGKIVISDFNVHGLAIMDQVHAMDGREHEVGPDTLADMKKMLIARGFEVEQHWGVNIDIIVAYRGQS